MTLRKSDKIIAIIGVIILIIAGIGIFVYMDTDDGNGNGGEDTEETMSYPVESKIVSKPPVQEKSQTIKQKLLGEQTVSFKAEIDASNVKNISVIVKFTDNNPGLLGKFTQIGADTLTVSVLDSEGKSVKSGSKKGSGTIKLEIDGPATEIYGPIEATSDVEAKQILEDQYKQFQGTYTIKISLKGSIIGFLREKLKGDSFKLEVSYSCYEYMLGEPDGEDGGNPPTDSSFDPSVYSITNYPGKQ